MAGTASAGATERVFVGGAGARFQVDLEEDLETGEPRSLISGGAFGAVYRATWDGVEVAAKTLHMFQNPRMYGLHEDMATLAQLAEEFEQEMSLISKLRHENIIGFVGVAYKKYRRIEILAWICTELAVTSLKATIYESGGVPHDLVPRYTRDAANGLHYMHSQKVLHRDVKPANMLIGCDGRLKLCDLGVAKVVDRASRLSTSKAGTALYLPPETVDHDKKDIFGLGFTMVEMILEEAPDDDGKSGGDRRPDQALRAAERRPDLAALVRGCTAYDHRQRFRAADVLACEDLQPKAEGESEVPKTFLTSNYRTVYASTERCRDLLGLCDALNRFLGLLQQEFGAEADEVAAVKDLFTRRVFEGKFRCVRDAAEWLWTPAEQVAGRELSEHLNRIVRHDQLDHLQAAMPLMKGIICHINYGGYVPEKNPDNGQLFRGQAMPAERMDFFSTAGTRYRAGTFIASSERQGKAMEFARSYASQTELPVLFTVHVDPEYWSCKQLIYLEYIAENPGESLFLFPPYCAFTVLSGPQQDDRGLYHIEILAASDSRDPAFPEDLPTCQWC